MQDTLYRIGRLPTVLPAAQLLVQHGVGASWCYAGLQVRSQDGGALLRAHSNAQVISKVLFDSQKMTKIRKLSTKNGYLIVMK